MWAKAKPRGRGAIKCGASHYFDCIDMSMKERRERKKMRREKAKKVTRAGIEPTAAAPRKWVMASNTKN